METAALQALGYLGGQKSVALARRTMRLAKSREAQAAATAIQKIARGVSTRRSKYVNKLRQEKSNLGKPRGSETAKRHLATTNGYDNFEENQWHHKDIAEIERVDNTAVAALNRRQRDIIQLVGFKICFTIRLLDSAVGTHPVNYANFAVVACKNRGSVDQTDWFRAVGPDSRQINFNDSSLTAFDRHCLPINNDEFVVLKHLKNRLTYQTDVFEGAKGTGRLWHEEFYVPINRQIQYEGANGFPETSFAIAWWTGKEGQTAVESQINTAFPCSIEYRVVTYFKEPQPVMKYQYRS